MLALRRDAGNGLVFTDPPLQIAGDKSPSHKQCWLRIMPQRWRLGEGSWTANPNRLDFDLYSAYVFMIPMWVAMSQIQD